jgi:4-oxalocrotonate tautomerase
MPLVNVQVIENVFTPQQKQDMISRITDAMVAIEGEALREVTWVKIDEVKEGNWGIGGQALHARDVHRMQRAGS